MLNDPSLLLAGLLVSGPGEDQTLVTARKQSEALADVPLGHKVAIKPMKAGETVLKYDHDIGKTLEDIPLGGYVHAHNIKTKRW